MMTDFIQFELYNYELDCGNWLASVNGIKALTYRRKRVPLQFYGRHNHHPVHWCK